MWKLQQSGFSKHAFREVPFGWKTQEEGKAGTKKVYTTTVETPFFCFSGSEALWYVPFFPDLWCIPFSLVSQENGLHHSFFAL